MLPQLLVASWGGGLAPPRGRMLGPEHLRSSTTITGCWGCTTSMLARPRAWGVTTIPTAPAFGHGWGQPQGDHSVTAPRTRGPAHLAADIEPDGQLSPVRQVNHGHQVLVVGRVYGQGETVRWWDTSFCPQKPPKTPSPKTS